MSTGTKQKPSCNCGLPDDPGDSAKMKGGQNYWVTFCDRCGRFKITTA